MRDLMHWRVLAEHDAWRPVPRAQHSTLSAGQQGARGLRRRTQRRGGGPGRGSGTRSLVGYLWAIAGACGVALTGVSRPVWAALGVVLLTVAGLGAGFGLSPRPRARVVRAAALGATAGALLRALGGLAAGGIGGLSLADIVPPAATSLAGLLAAVVLGAWWASIWGRAPTGRGGRHDATRRWRPLGCLGPGPLAP